SIEFFGDEVDSIRTFDVETQLSLEQVKKVSIIPNVDASTALSMKMSFLEYINSKTVVFLKNEELFSSAIDNLFKKATEVFKAIDSEIKHAKPSELFCNSELLKEQLNDFTKVKLLNSSISISDLISISFSSKPQASFNKQFKLLLENLNDNTEKGYKHYIFCSSEQQAKRFHDIFEDISTP